MTKKIFISYLEEDLKEHIEEVKSLVNKLKITGFDIKFYEEFSDKEKANIENDIPSFMEESVINSDKILMICTPQYAKEANDAGYKKLIITDDLLRLCGISKKKIIPILFSSQESESLPNFMKKDAKKLINYAGTLRPSLWTRVLKKIKSCVQWVLKKIKSFVQWVLKKGAKPVDDIDSLEQIINAINKKQSGWLLGELLAPYKAKRKKNIRFTLAQKKEEKEKIRKETIEMIKLFYERHQYYHTHYWKLVIKVFTVIITLMTLPFFMKKYFPEADQILYSLPPIVSIFITIFLIMGLKSEEAQLHNIELKTNCLLEALSENYSNFDPTIFSNAGFISALNRYKMVNMVLVLLVGLSIVSIIEGLLIALGKIVINPV